MEAAEPRLAAAVKADAFELGFDLVGVASPEPSAHLPFYERWLSEGRHGEMAYLARPDALVSARGPEKDVGRHPVRNCMRRPLPNGP